MTRTYDERLGSLTRHDRELVYASAEAAFESGVYPDYVTALRVAVDAMAPEQEDYTKPGGYCEDYPCCGHTNLDPCPGRGD